MSLRVLLRVKRQYIVFVMFASFCRCTRLARCNQKVQKAATYSPRHLAFPASKAHQPLARQTHPGMRESSVCWKYASLAEADKSRKPILPWVGATGRQGRPRRAVRRCATREGSRLGSRRGSRRGGGCGRSPGTPRSDWLVGHGRLPARAG